MVAISKEKINDNKIKLTISGEPAYYLNTLRRIFMNEIPTMAVDELEIKENNSVMYDEVLAHRIGLIPLRVNIDDYNLPEKCTCKGAGCAKCQTKITLSVEGPAIIYAKDLKPEDPGVEIIYPEMPIVKLLPGQKIEFVATAKLGLGKDHAKHSTSLVYYKHKAITGTEDKVDVEKLTDDYEFIIETWGQLGTDEIVERGVKEYDNMLNDFEKMIKALK